MQRNQLPPGESMQPVVDIAANEYCISQRRRREMFIELIGENMLKLL
jgi:hypothetical protein